MAVLNWQCPYCGTFTTINDGDETNTAAPLNGRSRIENAHLFVQSISCPNPKCGKLTVDVEIANSKRYPNGSLEKQRSILRQRLMPEGNVMPLPDVVPEAIRKTYREAVLVQPISGAASAALSRRCLQGVLRDFFQIPQNRRGELGAELAFVKDQINTQIWDDIQAVRAVGDIGAHMDKNIDYIVDVEPKEAALLIGLLEELFKVWYIERERRVEQSGLLKALLTDKRHLQKEAKEAGKVAAPMTSFPDHSSSK